VTTENPQHVVFIDSRVPDMQDLLDGLQPGEQAFVIDPSSDGIEQIADILSANDLTGLSSVSIVGHGSAGAISLGSTVLSESDLSSHSTALAQIGAALAPGGSLQLYGCDVAAGAAGQQFITDLSGFVGGADPTHDIGLTASGENWTLDASTAPSAAPLPAPFTVQATANFAGTLATSFTGQFWYVAQGNPTDARLAYINIPAASNSNTSSATTVLVDNNPTVDLQTGFPEDVQVDWAAGVYFMVVNGGPDGSGGKILMGHVNSTAAPVVVYTAPVNDSINTLQVDQFSHHVYVGRLEQSGDPNNTGILDFTYSPATVTPLTLTPVATNNGFLVKSNQQTAIQNDPTFGVPIFDPRDFTLEHATNQLFWVNETDGGAFTNEIYWFNLSSPTTLHPLLKQSQFPLTTDGSSYPNGYINSVEVDPSTHLVYFTTESQHPSPDATYNAAVNKLYWISDSATGSTDATALTLTGLPANNHFYPGKITLDTSTRQLYVVSEETDTGGPTVDDVIYVFQLSTDGHSASLVNTLAPSPNFTNDSANFEGMTFDVLPILVTSGTTTAALEQSVAVTLLTGTPTISDPDGDHLAKATVQITGGTFTSPPSDESSAADDHLGFAAANVTGNVINGTSITFSYNSATETLTLTGYDTLAHYATALAEVQYNTTGDNPTNYDSNTTRTITWQVDDGAAGDPSGTNTTTTTVSVIGVNDPPTLTAAATASFTEKGGAKALSSAASIFDPDSLALANATVKITGGTFAGDGDVLAATVASTSITASYNSSTETLTLTGVDSLTHYQQVLDSVTFNQDPNLNPTNYGSNTTRTVTWQLNDGSGSFNLSTVVTTTLSVTAVNDPPTLTATAGTVAFTERQTVTLSPSVTVSDPDNLGLQSATVKVAGGTFTGDGDVLAATTTGTAITASYNSATETLVFSGSDTLANYQTVLDKVTFASGANPDDYGSQKTRTITWVLNDGSGSNTLSTAQTTTVSITAINDPPVLTSVAPSASYVENASATTLASAAVATDVDSLTLANATVQIVDGTFAGDGDVLATTTTGTSITASYNSTTETLVLFGSDTLAHYQTVLDRVTFSTPSDNPTNFGADPTRTVTWLLNDGSGSNNLSTVTTTTISVTAVNDPPTLTVAASASFTENAASVALSPAVTISDPDNTTWAGATVKVAGGTFAADGDVLAANTTGTAITASYDPTTETLTLSGSDTLADYRQVLQSVSFVTASDNPTNYGSAATRTITWVANDGSGSNNLSTTQTETLSITATNDAPTLSSVATAAAFTEKATAVTLAGAGSVSDPDNLNLASATVKITGGTFAGDGDVLAATTTGTSITASYNSTTETLTLTGSDTLAHYQQVLDSVTFNSTSINPTNYGSNTTRTVTWVANDGSGSSNLSAPATTTVSITAVNDAPALSLGPPLRHGPRNSRRRPCRRS
jgi:lipopolysaccharide export system protein LptA